MIKIIVSEEINTIVENQAKKACEKQGIKISEFNQDANALAIFYSLREVGALDWEGLEKPVQSKVLQILKKGGNSSALRQKITEEKSATKASNLTDEVLEGL